MSNISITGTRSYITRHGQLLLAGLLAVALAMGVLAVFAPAVPAAMPAAGNNADVVAAIQRQETLKDQRLDRMGASASPLTALSAERAEEHRWLNQRSAAQAQRNQRLFDLNEAYYATEASPDKSSNRNARLAEL